MSEVETTTEGTPKPAPKKAPAKKTASVRAAETISMPRRARVYTFEQWARRRGIKPHHKGGLRAFVSTVERPRSLDEWDSCFKDY